MNLNYDIQRHFLVTVIVVTLASIVIFSTPILNSAYAEGSDVDRPSYVWSEQLGRDVVKVSEIHERMACDFASDYARALNQMPEDPKAATKDIIGLIPGFGPLHNTLVFDVPELVQTQNDDLRCLKGIKAFTNLLIPLPSTLERVIQKDWDIIPSEPYIPNPTKCRRVSKFSLWHYGGCYSPKI